MEIISSDYFSKTFVKSLCWQLSVSLKNQNQQNLFPHIEMMSIDKLVFRCDSKFSSLWLA